MKTSEDLDYWGIPAFTCSRWQWLTPWLQAVNLPPVLIACKLWLQVWTAPIPFQLWMEFLHIAIIRVRSILYSGKYSWGPNFVLFVLSLSERKFNTRNVHYGGHVFLCKMDRTKIKHTNHLEIAQNEIWTPWKFPAIRYSILLRSQAGMNKRALD